MWPDGPFTYVIYNLYCSANEVPEGFTIQQFEREYNEIENHDNEYPVIMLLNLVKIRGVNYFLPERDEITDIEYRELINLIYLLFIDICDSPSEYGLLVHGFHHRLCDRGFDGSEIYIRTRTINYDRHKAIPDLDFNLIYLRSIQGRGNWDDAQSY